MTPVSVWVILAFCCSAISTACALFVAFRGQAWRNSDEAKIITQALADHGTRLTKLETQIENVATKGDIQTIRAEIKGVEGQVEAVGAGVARIESYFLEKGIK